MRRRELEREHEYQQQQTDANEHGEYRDPQIDAEWNASVRLHVASFRLRGSGHAQWNRAGVERHLSNPPIARCRLPLGPPPVVF